MNPLHIIGMGLKWKIVSLLQGRGHRVIEVAKPAEVMPHVLTNGNASRQVLIVDIDSAPGTAWVATDIRERKYKGVLLGLTEKPDPSVETGSEMDELIFLRGRGDRLIHGLDIIDLMEGYAEAILRRHNARVCPSVGKSIVFGSKRVQIEIETREVFFDRIRIPLTVSEFDILETIGRRPGIVFSRNQLGEVIKPGGRDPRTVDSHIKRIRKKFGETGSDPEGIIETIYGAGYRALA